MARGRSFARPTDCWSPFLTPAEDFPVGSGSASPRPRPRVLEFTWGFTEDDTHVPPEYREPHPERTRFELVPSVNSLVDDGHPNGRRDGLEIFLYSVRSDLPDGPGWPGHLRGDPGDHCGSVVDSGKSRSRNQQPCLRDPSELLVGRRRALFRLDAPGVE